MNLGQTLEKRDNIGVSFLTFAFLWLESELHELSGIQPNGACGQGEPDR